jgi:hypothetical protein
MKSVINLPYIIIILVSFFAVNKCSAQYKSAIRQGNSDYPVPVPAALEALSGDNPSILYPGTVRSLSFSLNHKLENSRQLSAAGIEVAPFLIGNYSDLSKYLSGRLIRVLLRTRISIASTITENGSSYIALGFRWMLHDDADVRSDSVFQKALIALGNKNSIFVGNCINTVTYDSSAYKICLSEKVSRQDYLQQKIDSLREAIKDSLWNKSVFEIAAAMLYSSFEQGSLSNSLRIRQYRFFFSGSLPFLGTNGQFVFGASGWLGFDNLISDYQRKGALIIRPVYGNLNERFFIETKLISANKYKPDITLGIGAMINVANGFWLGFGTGESLLKENQMISKTYLNFSYGTPEI